MKASFRHNQIQDSLLGHKPCHLLVFSCVILTGLVASSPQAFAQRSAALGSPAPAPLVQESPESSNASRFVEPEEAADYIATIKGKLNILNREIDPFGQIQDTTVKREVRKPQTTRRPTQVRRTSFDDLVSKIKIKAIMPASKSFMTGNRSFKEGDRFPLRYRGQNIQIEVAKVSARKVDFKNVASGEISTVELKLLPAGMSPDDEGFSAPGMVEDNPDAPLQLDTSSGL